MRRPFVFLTIPMILGIIFYYYIYTNIYLILVLFLLSLIVNLIGFKFSRKIISSIFISIFLLGILIAGFKMESSYLIKYIDRPVELKGNIKEVKSVSQEEGRYVIQVDNIFDDGRNTKVSEKALLKVLGNNRLELGDKVRFMGVLKEPLPNTNPKLFNYKLSLLADNIHTTITIKDYSILDIDKKNSNPLSRLKKGFVSRVEGGLDLYLTEENGSLMKSILLGKYSYLDEESSQKFRDLGLAHILAVSGLHIGIITSLFITLFAYLGMNRKLNIILTIGVIWIYGYIIGNPVSVLRANIMFSILLISQLGAEPYDSINTMFFSLFILIIINPFWIFNLSFQLSFIATFSILYFVDKLNSILYLNDGSILKSLSGMISVQIGLLPVLAYYFNRIPVISLVTNLVAVPIFTICLILSIFLIFFSLFSISISSSIGVIINFLLKIQFSGLRILGNFPVLNIRVPSPSLIGILIYYIMILIVFKVIDISYLNNRVNKSIVFYILLLIIFNTLIYNFHTSIDIDFIDVGQGDSILLKTRNGNYLIDTGGNIFGDFDIGKNILLPYLEKEGIFKLKGVFISHFDADHCKSLPYLIDNIKIENIYFGYEREENELYRLIGKKALEKGIPISVLKKGDILKIDKDTNIYVIGPSDNIVDNLNSTDNDLSLVLLLNYFDINILFTGDIERMGEENVNNSLNLNIDFLKVPHHGSNTSSGEDFINRLKPSIGIISVGRNNGFGHPHKEVLNRYKAHNIEIYRTDELGLINLILNKDEYKIVPFLKDRWSILDIVSNYSSYLIYLIIYFYISYKIIIKFLLIEEEMAKIELQGIY
ncbi:DNA internalization-related competence protein ComEC/Rec2 [Clostridium sp. Cult1]|uniref:DNA internalization-related competence protein ComEC/Rec2 n=1 Tax=Clostridium sp. Cult1 TaxID=2079002 RepID=UPI003013A331|nr:DNA internalization-related competence protein ComEC/Rec2 [Clostridium sp. Cult1]